MECVLGAGKLEILYQMETNVAVHNGRVERIYPLTIKVQAIVYKRIGSQIGNREGMQRTR